ncbi:hypothetical protein LMH87_006228 [Akanthomyces muscarius]|uniref:Uncharacterized protein n=1 Tax=Akanthomyces muscarius TaxID=2231603 RepID=A0A9W8UST8_AKAMU|nr:hypothetical protein LMH87_006228 [Akanthomyces muscarius]KAJ4164558.1 hypothetical protein LMH87_006228 [Akanthomyces muscarius]
MSSIISTTLTVGYQTQDGHPPSRDCSGSSPAVTPAKLPSNDAAPKVSLRSPAHPRPPHLRKFFVGRMVLNAWLLTGLPSTINDGPSLATGEWVDAVFARQQRLINYPDIVLADYQPTSA